MVNATAFDIRHSFSHSLPITIFRMNCETPTMWIPLNYTDLSQSLAIPNKTKSTSFELQAVPTLNCNETVVT